MNNSLTQFSTAEHLATCPACQFQAASPAIWEEISAFFEERGHTIPLIEGDLVGWRTRAKLAVRGGVNNPAIGLFKSGSHEVVSALDCPMHCPSINEGLRLLREEMIKAQIVPYHEARGSGILRYVQLVVERKTERIQLTLVVQKRDNSVDNLLQALSGSPFWHSIWLNFQKGPTNTIFGQEWEHCSGEREFWESLHGQDVCFHPSCFAQANLTLFEKILASIERETLPNSAIVEYYAGVGVISLCLLDKAKSAALNEITPLSEECFRKSLSRLQKTNASFHLGPAEKHTSLLKNAEVVIVDPPRKGIEAFLKAEICRSSAKQLIHISCSWKSFQRDCLYFLENGWTIEKAEAYLFFPGSDEVEILCFLKKSG